jgi:hypothetical protein
MESSRWPFLFEYTGEPKELIAQSVKQKKFHVATLFLLPARRLHGLKEGSILTKMIIDKVKSNNSHQSLLRKVEQFLQQTKDMLKEEARF